MPAAPVPPSKTYAASVIYPAPARVPEFDPAQCIDVKAGTTCICTGAGGISDVGRRHAGHWPQFFRIIRRLHYRVRPALREGTMVFDYALAGVVAAGLLAYLTYALLRPERF
jgi:K+-transporting ATPase KdpF subunit